MYELSFQQKSMILRVFLTQLIRMPAPAKQDTQYFLRLFSHLQMSKDDLQVIKQEVRETQSSEKTDQRLSLHEFFSTISGELAKDLERVPLRIALTGIMNAMQCQDRFSPKHLNQLPELLPKVEPLPAETLDDLFSGVISEDDLDDAEEFEVLVEPESLQEVEVQEPVTETSEEVDDETNELDTDPESEPEPEALPSEETEPVAPPAISISGGTDLISRLMLPMQKVMIWIQPKLHHPAILGMLKGNPPQVIETPSVANVDPAPALFIQRWIAAVIDGLFFAILYVCFWPLTLLATFLPLGELTGWFIWLIHSGFLVLLFALAISLEASVWQGTPGKVLLGLGVRTLNGVRPGRTQIIKRSSLRLSSFVFAALTGFVALILPSLASLIGMIASLCSLAVFVGCFMSLRPDRLTLHDRLSQTTVVPLAFQPNQSA